MPRRTTKNCDFMPERSTDSCAPQAISTKNSEPIWSMGKERREAVDNRYLSPDQAKHMSPRNTANVDFLPEISSMDKQCLSTLVTEPRFKLNHADRYEYENVFIIFILFYIIINRVIYQQFIKKKCQRKLQRMLIL